MAEQELVALGHLPLGSCCPLLGECRIAEINSFPSSCLHAAVSGQADPRLLRAPVASSAWLLSQV